MKIHTVSVAIPTYSSSDNLIRLIGMLLLQKSTGFIIRNVTVYSDASPDNTEEKLANIKHPLLKVIVATKRRGFAYAVKYLLTNLRTDIVITLNDDILIKDKNFIELLVQPFLVESSVGLVGGRIEPLPAKTFWEESARLNFLAIRQSFAAGKNQNHVNTCNGKVMALSRNFINSIDFPKDLSLMANVDAYLYFSCITSGFLYVYNKHAVVFFKFADTFGEFVRWTLRNVSTIEVMTKTFGKIVYREFRLPKSYYRSFTFTDIVTHLPQILFLVFFHFYIQWKKGSGLIEFNPIWKVIKSTKNISV